MKKAFILLTSLLLPLGLPAQEVQTLSLEDCRQMAVAASRDLEQARIDVQMAGYDRKIALANYFPNVSATGAYLYNNRDIALVSESGEERRRFANGVLSQMDRAYLAAVQTYNRLLAQRNKMLKDGNVDWDLMDVFDARMAAAAQPAYEARTRLAEDLRPVIQS